MQVLGVTQTRPVLEVRRGACDCHIHLFGPQNCRPLAEERLCTPSSVILDEFAPLQGALSTERGVGVQASAHGTTTPGSSTSSLAGPQRCAVSPWLPTRRKLPPHRRRQGRHPLRLI